MMRFDFLFTYWIIAWYVLYVVGLVSYNPKGLLVIDLLAHVVALIVMLYYSYSYTYLFVGWILLLNVLPLWYIWKDPYAWKDVYATLLVGLMYLAWVWIYQVNPISVLRTLLHHVKHNKIMGPGMQIIYDYLYYDRKV